ncbi:MULTISPECIES: hypothetical protein [unclassified Nocardia]|uniref:hypothetical protein n=1 Tax=unclassified Nocardia TaxID=2637762 RepID=UPI001CE4A208|nr:MULTISPECIES: hypothetical protein [unclassified Nocardia]
MPHGLGKARIRRAGPVLALLAAILLTAPAAANCELLCADDDEGSTAFVDTAYASTTDAPQVQAHGCPDNRGPDVIDSTTRAAGTDIVAPLIHSVPLDGMASRPVEFEVSRVGTVRGPPVAELPACDGRVLLDRFCIARR